MDRFNLFLNRHPILRALFYGLSGAYNPLGISQPPLKVIDEPHESGPERRIDQLVSVLDRAEQQSPESSDQSSVREDGAVELPREYALAPRRWRQPSGTLIFQAINPDATKLLKENPDDFFRHPGR